MVHQRIAHRFLGAVAGSQAVGIRVAGIRAVEIQAADNPAVETPVVGSLAVDTVAVAHPVARTRKLVVVPADRILMLRLHQVGTAVAVGVRRVPRRLNAPHSRGFSWAAGHS